MGPSPPDSERHLPTASIPPGTRYARPNPRAAETKTNTKICLKIVDKSQFLISTLYRYGRLKVCFFLVRMAATDQTEQKYNRDACKQQCQLNPSFVLSMKDFRQHVAGGNPQEGAGS